MISPHLCSHEHVSPPRARGCGNGAIQYRRQCIDCGQSVGSSVAKAKALEETNGRPEPFDELLLSASMENMRHERERDAEDERRRWWGWYNDYLLSDEWKERRQKVIKRANGICEGCCARAPVHIHHLTYKHLGNELLFELVALCETCHAIAHEDSPNPLPLAMRGTL